MLIKSIKGRNQIFYWAQPYSWTWLYAYFTNLRSRE